MKLQLLLALLLPVASALAAEKSAENYRLQVDLTDGSRLIGTTTMAKLPVSTDVGEMQLPLAAVREVEFKPTDGKTIFRLRNGDVLSGRADWQALPLKTQFGQVSITLTLIRKFTVSAGGVGALPPGEGPLAFGGLNWTPQRRAFEVQGEKLVALPKARPGFEYGQGGHGRSGWAFSNIGSEEWRDYRIEFTFGSAAPDPGFDPYRLAHASPCLSVRFHVVSHPENWNEKDASFYDFGISNDGTWNLACTYHFFCNQQSGWGGVHEESHRAVASGKGPTVNPAGSRLTLEVQGKRIRAWLDDQQVLDVTDEKMDVPVGDVTLDHGGLGIGWAFEYLGWVADFKAQKL